MDTVEFLKQRFPKPTKEGDWWHFDPTYEDAFRDCEILVWKTVGSYQGDYFVLVRRNEDGHYGFAVIGYGSCSGCDALIGTTGYGDPTEETFVETASLLDGVLAGTHWEPSRERMREYLQKECDKEMLETYIYREEEKKETWEELLGALK